MKKMRAFSLMCTFVAAAALVQPACARQGSPEEMYRTGRYEDAIRALDGRTDAPSRKLLVRSLMEIGRYDDAVTAALGGAAVNAVPVEVANVAGEALWARGRRAEAEQLYARAAASNAPDAIRAKLNLAVAKWERGARPDALRDFDAFIDIYNDGRAKTAEDLTAVGVAVAYLGVTDPQLFHDAIGAFDDATKADATYAEPKLLSGELFLDKYNSTEASAFFREVLEQNPRNARAWLGLAKAKFFDGTGEAVAYADSSLAINPNDPEARAFRASALLGLENFEGAAAEAQKALEVDPAHTRALAMLGATRYLRGDHRGYQEMRSRALALDPQNGRFDVLIAYAVADQRRYRESLTLAKAGLALDSTNWMGHALVGLTELRLGSVDRAKTALDVSFKGDPYNAWVKNTLDLLDTYPEYTTRKSNRYEFFLHGREADLLEIYMSELAEEAYDKLAARYGARPDVPVRVEVYPRHADFSVRSVGLAGLGALGVAFGNILALDSPAAREAGEFNWGSTLWHEIAHAVTLHASGNLVPRWLTEGISVLEERRAREGWGDDVTLDFIVALKKGDILPASQLNAGFVRPKYPEQLMHAYYQASVVAEYIEQQHGANALRDMLRAYGDGKSNEQVFRDVLKTDLKAFDEKFAAHMQQKFATQLAAIDVPRRMDPEGGMAQIGGSFADAMRKATEHMEAERWAEAIAEAERARAAFPEYAAPNGPYRMLHAAHVKMNNKDKAIEALKAQTLLNERDYESNLLLADMLEEKNDRAGAAAALERAIYIHPYDVKLHDRLAGHYTALKQFPKTVRERRALLALNPVNRADALYKLALALSEAGQRDEARREVLRALEIAPNFAEAQDLLLKLRGGS
jgi:tetratricopeptide (TPR) repeat protein